MTINKILFFVVLSFLILVFSGCSNRWSGPNNTQDTIFRNGPVGIGKTPNAGVQLHVFKADSGDVMAQIQSDVQGGNAILRFNRGGSTPWDIGYDNSDFQFVYRSSPNVNALTIKPNGNVGIGSMAPAEKLEVAGNIRVTGGSFIDDGTTLTVPDYVFEKDYVLMSLDKLQEFVTREKHLPNLPAAEEIAKNGLNLSQNQMRLLEKIEQLTLYVLHQNEQIKHQQQEIDALKYRLNNK